MNQPNPHKKENAFDKQVNPTQFFGITPDASSIEFKKNEAYLFHLAAIVESSDDAIISKSLEGIITSWNKGSEKMFGYTANEAVGKPITMLIPESFLDEEKIILEKIRNNEMIDHFETVRIAKNGEQLYVSLTVSPLKNSEGIIIGVSKIARDISARKKAELENKELTFQNAEKEKRARELVTANKELALQKEQIIDVNKELESFSYSVSHDLRAPLRAISGYTKMLKENMATHLDPETNRLMDNIVFHTNKMGQLIDDLLSFSRVSRRELVKSNVAMQAIVSDICSELKNAQANRNIEFHVNSLLPALADNMAIKQVWLNLISNAVKYTNQKKISVIDISSEIKGNEIIYTIKDNGAGFDMRYANKLFGVFQRLHSEEEFEGSGVGLALVHRIISKHGGRIWAQATVNEGATFYFTLHKS